MSGATFLESDDSNESSLSTFSVAESGPMFRALVTSAALLAACHSDGGSTDETLESTSTPAKKGSAGGFTASLSADLADGSAAAGKGERTAGTATSDRSPSGSAAEPMGTDAGSAKAPPAATGTDAGSAKAPLPAAATTGAGAGSATSTTAAATTDAGAGSAKAIAGASTTPATTGVGAGSAKAIAGASTAPATTGVGAGSAKSTTTAAAGTTGGAAPAVARSPVVLTPELKAIKLSLLPNWKRDIEEAGTISLFVDVQSKDETAVFKFHYGYDDPRAPSDREAYKKFLTDSKILTVAADRQRGAAWLLEGSDASGPAFRVLVIYGGKRLVCYGSLYKGSGFGDIRDEVIIQAKKICETIQL